MSTPKVNRETLQAWRSWPARADKPAIKQMMGIKVVTGLDKVDL